MIYFLRRRLQSRYIRAMPLCMLVNVSGREGRDNLYTVAVATHTERLAWRRQECITGHYDLSETA